MEAGALTTLERVGAVADGTFQKTTIRRQTRITDAESSPDGKWVAMRTNKELLLLPGRGTFAAGHFDMFWELDLSPLDEAQVRASRSPTTVMYIWRVKGRTRLPGTFAHLKCQLPE
jgi:hypothetical protein